MHRKRVQREERRGTVQGTEHMMKTKKVQRAGKQGSKYIGKGCKEKKKP